MNDNNLTPAVKFHRKEDNGWKSPVKFDATKKSPEHRRYLVLVKFIQEDRWSDNCFIDEIGRTETYFKIKEMLEEMDVDSSIVMLEGNRVFVDHITVLQFIRHIRDNELVDDDDFGIVDQILAECEEEGGEYEG